LIPVVKYIYQFRGWFMRRVILNLHRMILTRESVFNCVTPIG
jgi:hypothetical protein